MDCCKKYQMMNHTKLSIAEESAATDPRDTIHIMRDVFQPVELNALVQCLEEDGHRCAIFEGLDHIHAAISHPRCKMLFVGGVGSELPLLIETVQDKVGGMPDIPVMVYLKQILSVRLEQLLVPEIDDFVLEPLNPEATRLRVNRLCLRFTLCCDELKETKLNLISHFGMRQFIGQSPSFLAAIENIPRMSICDAPVLLLGDTGTGKEMCARAIHYLSPRANSPFVPVNCGSIPIELFENEMFGHERGAFTDAHQSHRGLVAEAEGGTLFLDEVDSLTSSAQVKLLRFLQDRQYRRLGSSQYRQANVRMIAASNRNLQQLVRERVFREDLYYRLNILSVALPALRERQEDIMPLASHFLKISAREYGRSVKRFSRDAMQKLLSHTWPGNVRELDNVVRQAVVLSDGEMISAQHIGSIADHVAQTSPLKESFKVAKSRVIETFERAYLTELLSACGGNISKAAREAKKDRRALFALLKKYDIAPSYSNRE